MDKFESIWIIDPYEEIPIKGWREGRYYLLGKELVKAGFKVTLFISNFSHRTKKYLQTDISEELFEGVLFKIIPGFSYKKNISFSRILYEVFFIKRLLKTNSSSVKPRCIIVREPALFLSGPLVRFCKINKIKLIIDVIDLWPEVFKVALPSVLRRFSDFIFYFLYERRRRFFLNASAFIAVSPDYLDLANSIKAGIPSNTIFWGCDSSNISDIIITNESAFLEDLNLKKGEDDFWIIYAGTLGDNYDIKSIIYAAEQISNLLPNIKFLIAGSGPLEEWLIKYFELNCPSNINFLGSLQTDKLLQLFRFCDIGLCTYSQYSTVSMPIKAYDYFVAGLPVINSLGRNLGKIVTEYDLGYNYEPENMDSFKKTILEVYAERKKLGTKKNNVKKIALQFEQKIQYSKIVPIVNKILYV